MLRRDPKSRTQTAEYRKTIDMVTRLFVHVIKSDTQIKAQEIGILYSLLTNLFSDIDISWEMYVRNILESEYDIAEVLEYLNRELIRIDKLRIILSLIILAKTDQEYEISEITDIIDLCRQFGFEPDPFVDLINHFEAQSHDPVAIPFEYHVSHIQDSLFPDYLVFGKASSCDIRFRKAGVGDHEALLFAIDTFLFVSTSSASTLEIDGRKLRASTLYLLPDESRLRVSDVEYDAPSLWKMYGSKNADDEIVFRKSDYDFLVSKHRTRYSLLLERGSITLNQKEIVHGRKTEVYYDDVLQIRGYAPFTLLNVIQERKNIGVDNLIPRELFLCLERDFFFLSRTETARAITRLELDKDVLFIHPPRKGWALYLNKEKLEGLSQIQLNTDTITINKRNFRINTFFDLVEIPFEIKSLEVQDVKHYFRDGSLALDSISLSIRMGELVGILGQSGCGKSTLLKTINHEIIPTYGNVVVDGKNLSENLGYYAQFFGYVPQDDLLYPNLTVYENLWYRGRLRLPNISKATLDQKIINLLRQVNLIHRKDSKVGDYKKKLLSGGERKRLNIALEMLFEPTVLICDEPTSGLSFGDAEQVIDILKQLTQQDKIVIITIHQPNSSIYRKLDQVLLMDMGGRQVYYGSPGECFDYFDEELGQITLRRGEIERKRQLRTSDYMYDVISYPEYNDQGEQVFEQVNKQLLPKRLFPPEYWRDKFKRRMLLELIQLDAPVPQPSTAPPRPRRRKLDLFSQANQALAYIARSFKMRLRNPTNNVITFVQAPLLGLVISFILRHIPTRDPYSYSANNNIGIYIFVSVIAFIFLGLSNSIEEILDERKIILRERMISLRTSFYLGSKILSLGFFSLLQVLLYTLVSCLVLEIRGMALMNVWYFLLSSMVGFSIGLFTSSFLKDNKAIINLLPMILIPQIIFGGAVIEFERMNRSLTLIKNNPIPEVVQVIPSRWLFEGLTTAYAKHTAFHRKLAAVEKKRLTLRKKFEEHELSAEQYRQGLSGLRERQAVILAKWNPDKVLNSHLNSSVGIMDGLASLSSRNQFLASWTYLGGSRVRTWNFNALIILIYLLVINLVTLIKLRYYYKDKE
jgi:ABC-type multidrug transport system ATPase subunit